MDRFNSEAKTNSMDMADGRLSSVSSAVYILAILVVPFIELWPDSRLETLLAQRPDLVASYALRS